MPDRFLKFRPATFAFAIFCFVMPFATMSCPGGQFTFSGLQMVTGAKVQDEQFGSEPLAVAALLCALSGLVLCLLKQRNLDLAAGFAGATGGAVLLLLKSKIDHDALEKGGGMVQVSFDIGFWLAFLALAGGAVLSFLQWKERSKVLTKTGETATGATPSP